MFLLACSSNEKAPSKPVEKDNWQSFKIYLEDTSTVLVYNTSDTIEIKGRDESINYYKIGKKSIDSLFAWVDKLVHYRQPEETVFCSEYVGKLEIKIRYSEILSKSVSFISICKWDSFTTETQKIDSLIKLVTKH